jgi:hypothetical protein
MAPMAARSVWVRLPSSRSLAMSSIVASHAYRWLSPTAG